MKKEKKIKIEGWMEANEDVKQAKNYNTTCPKCRGKLRITDASRTCGIYFIWCENSLCRYCEEYTE